MGSCIIHFDLSDQISNYSIDYIDLDIQYQFGLQFVHKGRYIHFDNLKIGLIGNLKMLDILYHM